MINQIDPTSSSQLKSLLLKYDIKLIKRLGQNFLIDSSIRDKIAASAKVDSETRVLEIGSGLGALTVALAARSKSVMTVEIDDRLLPALKEVLAPHQNVTIMHGDFLKFQCSELLDEAFGDERGVVAANIPYYITTPIIERLLEHRSRIKRAVLLVQKEVANRIAAAADTDDYGSLSVFVQYHANPQIMGTVPPTHFLPRPEVESAILVLNIPETPNLVVRNEARFFSIVRAGFGQRRKTLLNALMRAPASFDLGFTKDDRTSVERMLAAANIDGGRRGETLTMEEFGRIADVEDF